MQGMNFKKQNTSDRRPALQEGGVPHSEVSWRNGLGSAGVAPLLNNGVPRPNVVVTTMPYPGLLKLSKRGAK